MKIFRLIAGAAAAVSMAVLSTSVSAQLSTKPGGAENQETRKPGGIEGDGAPARSLTRPAPAPAESVKPGLAPAPGPKAKSDEKKEQKK